MGIDAHGTWHLADGHPPDGLFRKRSSGTVLVPETEFRNGDCDLPLFGQD